MTGQSREELCNPTFTPIDSNPFFLPTYKPPCLVACGHGPFPHLDICSTSGAESSVIPSRQAPPPGFFFFFYFKTSLGGFKFCSPD